MADWPVQALRAQLEPLLPGVSVEVVQAIDSTNSELMRRVRAGRSGPVLLAAVDQTAGRGRLGRAWQSRPGDSLTFSLGLPLAPADWSGLSLAVGVAVAEALHPRIQLKWPNDLWLQGRKLGGILVETASFGEGDGRQLVVGIGLNLESPSTDRPEPPPVRPEPPPVRPEPPPVRPELVEGHAWAGAFDRLSPNGLGGFRPAPPAALHELWPGATAPEVLLRIAAPLVQALQDFERFGFAGFHGRYESRDLLRDRAVVLSDGRSGTAHGVTEQGALLVHTAQGMLAVTSAEVSVRPAPAA